MVQLIISQTVNRHFNLGTFRPFIVKHTKCHSSVKHVSLEVRELGSVRYHFSGLGPVRYSFRARVS